MAGYAPVIEPFYPKAGNGRRPYPLETMLRIHCMQHWYNLSDGARPHQGRMMEGQTPYSMFKKGLKLIPKEVRTKVA